MSAEVVALPGVHRTGDRKAFFLNEFGAMIDRFVADRGEEPEAFVVVLGGIRQDCRISWITQGNTEGAATAMIAMTVAVATKELVNPNT